MRRFLAFITIAMLALAANAQQSPTDTDAVRSKLTMRGYKAFYDVNYLFTIYPSDTDTGNSLGFSTSHGFQFNNYLYFGGGIGFNSFSATERHVLLYRYSASCDAIFSTAAPPRLSADAMATASARFTAHTTVLCSACASLSKTTTR